MRLPTASSVFKISLPLFVFLAVSCHHPTAKQKQYKALQNYFAKRQHTHLSKNTKTLFVLTEQGCSTCDKMFAQLIEKHLQDRNIWFLITATGAEIDLTPFQNKQPNIFFDQTVDNTKYLKMFDQTKVFFMKDNQVDTTISIEASEIETQLEYISRRISQRDK